MRLYQTPGNPATPPIGWSKDCSVDTVVDFLYRRTNGQFAALPPGPLPADLSSTTTLDGQTVPYVVRRERGTIDRFIYSIAILAPPGDPAASPDLSLWNRRLIYTFDGGVAIGHNQGTPGGGSALTTSASRRATRSSTRAGRARPRTTTSCSAPRRRS